MGWVMIAIREATSRLSYIISRLNSVFEGVKFVLGFKTESILLKHNIIIEKNYPYHLIHNFYFSHLE